MVKEIRSKFQEKPESNDVKPEEKEREPKLAGIASDYDLKLFQEAQAAASEKIVRFRTVWIMLFLAQSNNK